MHRWDGPQSFPYVITIFSAPNYCGSYENKAAVLIVDKGNLSLKQYEESDQPYRLPDNLDVFTWSMPFLAEKVTSMLLNVIKQGGDQEGEEELPDGKMAGTDRQGAVRGKVMSVARMNRMYTTLREEKELLLKIKNMSPDGRIPRGLLMEGRPAIKNGKRFPPHSPSPQAVLTRQGARQGVREETQKALISS